MTINLLTIAILLLSYLIGSIPFAYIFTKLFSHKNILNEGWKKSSASNVAKTAGKLPGTLTFIFDVLKGFFVVFLATYLGLDPIIIALCGMLAIVGHNWSIFLKFQGGRGFATLIGILLFFNPFILSVALIPIVILALTWTSAIGIGFSYLLLIAWSYIDNEYIMFYVLLLCILPLFLKRLTPLESLKGNFINRLLFDQDGVPTLKIKK